MGLILSLDNSIHSFNRAGFVGLLDQYTGAAAGYSLRKLSVNTTNVIRVRRSSDNAEDDFTADEITDGTLLAWVGNTASDNGFVTTWYDQAGSNDATQGTAASQPKIVDAGVLVEENGKPAILPDGVDDILIKTNTIDYQSIFAVGKPATNASNNILLNIGLYFAWEADKVIYRSNTFSSHSFPSDSTQGLVSVIAEGASNPRSVNAYRNGVASTSNPISLNLGQSNAINIFGRLTGDYDSPIQEIIIFDTDQSSNRTGIETNINDHYNIYP